MSIYGSENFIHSDMLLQRSHLLSCHCEAITLSFMAVAISIIRTGTNTPFRYFPQKHKKQKPLIDFKGFYVLGGVLRRASSPPQIKRRLLCLWLARTDKEKQSSIFQDMQSFVVIFINFVFFFVVPFFVRFNNALRFIKINTHDKYVKFSCCT